MKKIALSIALTLLAGLAAAQGFASRPITLIVPFPPGGYTIDIGQWDTHLNGCSQRVG